MSMFLNTKTCPFCNRISKEVKSEMIVKRLRVGAIGYFKDKNFKVQNRSLRTFECGSQVELWHDKRTKYEWITNCLALKREKGN